MKKKLTVVHTFADGTTIHQPIERARREQLRALYIAYQLHGNFECYLDELEAMAEGWESMLRKVAAKPGSLARRKSAAAPAWLTMLFRNADAARKAKGHKRVGQKWLAGEARRQIENNKSAYPDWHACVKAVTRRRAERFLATRR